MRSRFILFLSALVLFAACDNSTTTTTSSEARVSSFTFYADTTNPGLTTANYIVVHSTDTGSIYNEDSLDFGTCLDSVVPYITYKSTPASATYTIGDTTITSTGTDTLNMNEPVLLHVTASDTKHHRWYLIQLTVHQVDPELYIWKELTGKAYSQQNDEQQAFVSGTKLYLYINNGFSTRLISSTDGTTWTDAGTPQGLPVPCHVRRMTERNRTIYYAQDDTLYISTDYVHFTRQDYSAAPFRFVTMLMDFDETVWAVVQDRSNSRLQLAKMVNNRMEVVTQMDGLENGYLPDNSFPVTDFAALSIHATSERPRAIVMGGRTMDGTAVNTRWSFENDALSGYRLRDFSIEQPSFHTLTGISLIQYDGKLMLFGGIDNDEDWHSNILYSEDEGMNWYVPDSTWNYLPTTYVSRQRQSVVVDAEQFIYIIGGQTSTKTLSDVYRGRKNEKIWKK